jgi:peptidoglycan lytic transglycosylase
MVWWNTDKPLFAMSRTLSFLTLALLVALPAGAQQAEVGYASWYNRGFDGLTTASGEIYDHETLSAAHPSLAFGTVIRVTRVDDGRTVVVRVNDRMESGPGHVIDLSGGAARELGMLETGVARVRITQTQNISREAPATDISSPTAGYSAPPDYASSVDPAGVYTLQVGVFSTRAAAQETAQQFENGWIKSIQTASGTMYRVYYGSYDSEGPARSAQTYLWDAGVESFLRSL